MDPGPFTFRELALMAEEKKRFAGELAAWHVASIAAMFGSQVSPAEINPYRVWTRRELEARAEVKRRNFFGRLSRNLFGKDVYNEAPDAPGID